MPASVEASGLQAIDIMMPKKRQQGFAPGASSLGPSPAMTSHPGSQQVQSAAPSANANNFFGPFGTNGLPSSFIDTDILLNDDLWNQFSPAPNTGSHASNMAPESPSDIGNNAPAATDVPSEQAFGESYVNIPYTSSLDMFGLQSRTFGTVQPTHEALHRLGKDTPSMDECDSPDGSNGETTSTIATSVLTPSSLGTTVGSLPQTSGSRHHRSTSNASSTNRSKTARSLSRSRTRVAASAERRAAERSPSTERGGVGKAPSSEPEWAAAPQSVCGSCRTACSSAASATTLCFDGFRCRWIKLQHGPLIQLPGPDPSLEPLRHRRLGPVQLHLNYNEPAQWGTQSQASQPQQQPSGTASASSSLPTAHSFHASMAHLNLQTPSVSSGGNQAKHCCGQRRKPWAVVQSVPLPDIRTRPRHICYGQRARDRTASPRQRVVEGDVGALKRYLGNQRSKDRIGQGFPQQGGLASLARKAHQGFQSRGTKDRQDRQSRGKPARREDDDDDAGDDDDDVPSAAQAPRARPRQRG